jgi:cytochrome c553
MEPVAAELADTEITAMAGYYAMLDSPAVPAPAADDDGISRGRRLAQEGDAGADVPACDVCHSGDGIDAYPRLAGLPAPYQIGQLHIWREGGRSATAEGRAMAAIAARLTPAQIVDVSAYYAERRRP